METKSVKKSAVFFDCKICDYNTIHRSHWKKHINTKKHIGNIGNNLETKKSQHNICLICGKIYKSRSGLYKHRQLCEDKKELQELRDNNNNNNNNNDNNDNNDNDNNNEKTFMKTCMSTMMALIRKIDEKDKLFEKQQEQISEMIPRIGNNNNNKININVFLNEKCKDAINMSDFLETIKIKLENLDYIKDSNMQDSINTLFINQLKELDTYKRPIHCTDIKRETLYIKDNNDWSKDINREKIKKGFTNVEVQYKKKIADWEAMHPEWENDEKLRDEYISLIQKTHKYKKKNTENKLIKNIAKETLIDATIINN